MGVEGIKELESTVRVFTLADDDTHTVVHVP